MSGSRKGGIGTILAVVGVAGAVTVGGWAMGDSPSLGPSDRTTAWSFPASTAEESRSVMSHRTSRC
jgi:hypothetical protein